MNKEKYKCFVSGGAGLIGLEICNKLIEKGQKQLDKGRPPQVFEVGDYVRVALTNTDIFGEDTGSKMKKRHKKKRISAKVS